MQEKTWNKVKSLIASAPVLDYYKLTGALESQCESSQSGLGAALMQKGRPIAYAETESRYAQNEKEALVIVLSVEKFNDYSLRGTVAHTDHKQQESIFKKPLHSACSEEIARDDYPVAEV